MGNIPIGIVTPQGMQPAPYSAESLAEAATKEPQGVYTLARTYKRNQVVLLNDHLDRLEQSAELEGIAVRLDRTALRKALRTLIEQLGYADSRFRITVPADEPQNLIVSLEPFNPVPAEIIENGARVITVHLERHNPVAKTTDWMNKRKATVEAFPKGIYEGVLVSASGKLLEGTSSNFYGILDGMLRTADDSEVLSGIARRVLLMVAPVVVPVSKTAVLIKEIGQLQEALLTSAGRGVVPIVEIEGAKIGDGKPGKFTKQLREAYEAWIEDHLEAI